MPTFFFSSAPQYLRYCFMQIECSTRCTIVQIHSLVICLCPIIIHAYRLTSELLRTLNEWLLPSQHPSCQCSPTAKFVSNLAYICNLSCWSVLSSRTCTFSTHMFSIAKHLLAFEFVRNCGDETPASNQ